MQPQTTCRIWMRRLILAIGLLLSAGAPQADAGSISPKRFLGTWHEIARIEPLFLERGLTQVAATYRLMPDGRISVHNRGYDAAAREWRSISGTASFVGNPRNGQLSVTFFPPFSAGLNIVAVAPDYSWAVLTGDGQMFAWLLARSPHPSKATRQRLIAAAIKAGLDPSRFTFIR